MALDANTHGPDWQRRVRDDDVFACWVTANWHRDRFCQRQLAYARQLGKPIYFLVRPGTTAPATRPGEHVVYAQTIADAATAIEEIMRGDR